MSELCDLQVSMIPQSLILLQAIFEALAPGRVAFHVDWLTLDLLCDVRIIIWKYLWADAMMWLNYLRAWC